MGNVPLRAWSCLSGTRRAGFGGEDDEEAGLASSCAERSVGVGGVGLERFVRDVEPELKPSGEHEALDKGSSGLSPMCGLVGDPKGCTSDGYPGLGNFVIDVGPLLPTTSPLQRLLDRI